MKWSPLKAGVVTGLLVLLVGIVVGIALTPFIHGNEYERGQKFGQGIATFSCFAGVVAYFIQKRRTS